MTAEFLLAFATRVRPVVRHRTPILYPIVRLLIQWICPRKPKQTIAYIVDRARVVPMHPSVPHECDILVLPENTTFVLE